VEHSSLLVRVIEMFKVKKQLLLILLSMAVQLWTKVFVLTFFVYFILSDPDEPYDPGYGYGILVQ
jgi:hypothetical protein